MRKYAKAVVLIPLGIVILVFALANRQTVVFSLDPFAAADPNAALVFAMPLFALAFILVAIGVVIGGVVTWFKQGKWRRMARHSDSEVRALRAANEILKRDAESQKTSTSLPQIARAAPAGGLTGAHVD
jgi:hypothetical protein